ncbi:major pollen allergen Ole e 10 [Lolium perenne]|uniref:major pollen allergen Ole e 10 n=1 Tax=Lolium perenne TaxID=4522 RepID=UPI003A99916A
MASTAIRFITFVSALMLLLHCTYAAAAPIFQQRQSAKTWCVANPSANEAALRANMDFACSESDCSAIQGTGGCSVRYGGILLSRASVAMNAYYQAKGRNTWNCFFNGTGLISITDPSLGTCKYA